MLKALPTTNAVACKIEARAATVTRNAPDVMTVRWQLRAHMGSPVSLVERGAWRNVQRRRLWWVAKCSLHGAN